MTKRWLSLILTLAMLVTMFTGAGAAGVTPKGPAGSKIVQFVPSITDSDVTAGTAYSGTSIGYFLVDGSRPTEAGTISLIQSNVLVTFRSAEVSTIMVSSNAELLVSLPEFTTGANVLTIKSTGLDLGTTLDFKQFGSKTITLTGIKPITGLSDITWKNPSDAINQTPNPDTVLVGTKSTSTADQLTVTVNPTDATGAEKALIWESSDPTVLTVESAGAPASGVNLANITAKKAGLVTVTARTTDGKFSKTILLNVINVLPTTVSIVTTDVEAKIGETTQLTLDWGSVIPTDKSGTWSIIKSQTTGGVPGTPTSIATINSQTGLLTGVADGTVWVRFVANAKDKNGNTVQTPVEGTAITVSSTHPVKPVAPTATYTLGSVSDELEAGIYKGPITVTLASKTVGVQFFYTFADFEGDFNPSASYAIPYSGPFTISQTQNGNLSAIAVKPSLATPNSDLLEIEGPFRIKPAITGITLSSDMPTINGTDKATITATLSGTTGVSDDDKEIEWSVEPAGKYIITASATDPNTSATVVATSTAVDGDIVTVKATNAWSEIETTIKLTYKAVPISGITLDKTTASIAANASLQLKATILPANYSTTAEIVWSTSNKDVAEVTNGLVIGKSVGTAIIKVTVGSYSAQCNLTVTPAVTKVEDPVFTVTKDANNNDVVSIASPTIGSTVYVSSTDDGTIPNEPTVAYTGPITLIQNKTYNFKAQAKVSGMTDSNTVTFTVNTDVAVKSVALAADGAVGINNSYNGTTKTLTVSGLQKLEAVLTATINPTNAKDHAVTWASSNPAVVKVTGNALKADLETLALGNATITVTTKDGGFTASVNVVVNAVAASDVEMSPANANVAVGNYTELTAKVMPDYIDDKTVTWTSSRPTVASVDANGKVVALAYDATPGANNEVIITATANKRDANGNPKFATAKITVQPPAIVVEPLTFHTVDSTGRLSQALAGSATYDVETTFALRTFTDGASIYYTTDGTEPSASNGTLYTIPFKLSATTTIKAIALKEGLTTRPSVSHVATFNLKVTEITLSKDAVTMEQFDKVTVNYGFLPSNAITGNGTPTVNSDTPSVATVSPVDATNKSFTITGVSPGTAKVTVTGSDGVTKKEIAVTINKVAGVSIAVVGGNAQSMNIGDNKKLVANVLPSKITNQDVTWYSAASAVADVTSDGQVTAKMAGTITLVATAAYDTSVKQEVTLTVNPDPATIPALPVQMPVFTPSKQAFTAVAGDALTTVVGTLAAGTGETLDQILYYYNISIADVTVNSKTAKFSIDGQGVVTMSIANVGDVTTSPATFSYTWTLKWKTIRGTAGVLNGQARSVSGNTLTVTEKPTQDQLDVAAAKDIIGKLNIKLPKADAADEAAAKKALLAKLNEAIKDTGIELKEADLTKFEFTAATDTADGKINFTVNLKKGNVTDTVSGSAVISFVPPTMEIKAVAKSGYSDNGKTKPANNRWRFAFADGGAQFSVPGYSNATWKSSKPKYVSINATTGEATFLKRGTNVVITATVGTKKLTKRINVVNMASELKLQWKKGSKWVDFAKETPTILLGKKLTVRATPVVPGASAKMFGFSWSTGDSAIVTNNGKATRTQVLTAKAVGSTTVTIKLFNDVYATMPINVSATKGIGDDFVEEILDIEDIEEEELDEIGEPDEIEEIDEIDEIDEAA